MKCATSLPVGLRTEALVGEGGCGDCDKTEKGICRGVYRRRPFLRGGTGAGVSTAGDLGVAAGTVVVGAGDAAKELPNLGLSANDDFEAGREPLTRRAGVGMSLWPQQCPAGEDKLGACDRTPRVGMDPVWFLKRPRPADRESTDRDSLVVLTTSEYGKPRQQTEVARYGSSGLQASARASDRGKHARR